MQWSQHIYLFDLQSSMNYWRQQKNKLAISQFELYEKILLTVFGNSVTAVLCEHPWQGVFFLYYLVDNKLPGLHSLNSLFNKKAYEKLAWRHWLLALQDLAGHLQAIKARYFNASAFRAKTAQLQRFVQRLDLPGPYALGQAEVGAIKRRYSGWLGEAWAWTFLPASDDKPLSFVESAFPWRAFTFQQDIIVNRHLDYPVSQWDVVEPLLREDLDRLCGLRCWSSADRINTLHWCISLFNLEQVNIEIRFRNPCSLHKEAPTFKAAVYQAYYAYLDMMQKLTTRDSDLDLPAEMPFISWSLQIKQRLHIPQTIIDMFEDEKTATCYDNILELQNCLPEEIEHYAIMPDFVPEQLFSISPPGYKHDYDFSLAQWGGVSLARPLFYYRQPVALPDQQGRRGRFLERTACNWWQSQNTRDLVRDYFLMESSQGEYLWVFRNSAGEWYQHGIYS